MVQRRIEEEKSRVGKKEKKLELAEQKQINREKEIEIKKRRAFEKKCLIIFEHLHFTFTFKDLNNYERLIIHEMAAKHNLDHKTVDGKIIVSKIPVFEIESLVTSMKNVQIESVTKKYDLRPRSKK